MSISSEQFLFLYAEAHYDKENDEENANFSQLATFMVKTLQPWVPQLKPQREESLQQRAKNVVKAIVSHLRLFARERQEKALDREPLLVEFCQRVAEDPAVQAIMDNFTQEILVRQTIYALLEAENDDPDRNQDRRIKRHTERQNDTSVGTRWNSLWNYLRREVDGFKEFEQQGDLEKNRVAHWLAFIIHEGRYPNDSSAEESTSRQIKKDWTLSSWDYYKVDLNSFVCNTVLGKLPNRPSQAEQTPKSKSRLIYGGSFQDTLTFLVLNDIYRLNFKELRTLQFPATAETDGQQADQHISSQELLLNLRCPSCTSPRVEKPLVSAECPVCSTPDMPVALVCPDCGQPPNFHTWTCGCGTLGPRGTRLATDADVKLTAKRKLVAGCSTGQYAPTFLAIGPVLTTCPTKPRLKDRVVENLQQNVARGGPPWARSVLEALKVLNLPKSANGRKSAPYVQLKNNLDCLGRLSPKHNPKGAAKDPNQLKLLLEKIDMALRQHPAAEIQEQLDCWVQQENPLLAMWQDFESHLLSPYLSARAENHGTVHFVPLGRYEVHKGHCEHAGVKPSKRPSGQSAYVRFILPSWVADPAQIMTCNHVQDTAGVVTRIKRLLEQLEGKKWAIVTFQVIAEVATPEWRQWKEQDFCKVHTFLMEATNSDIEAYRYLYHDVTGKLQVSDDRPRVLDDFLYDFDKILERFTEIERESV